MKETLESLTKSFVIESQASNYLICCANLAMQDGYQITSEQLKSISIKKHDLVYKILKFVQDVRDQINEDMELDIAIEIIANLKFTDTKENIELLIKNEKINSEGFYVDFAKISAEEGLVEVSEFFRELIKESQKTEKMLKEIIENIV